MIIVLQRLAANLPLLHFVCYENTCLSGTFCTRRDNRQSHSLSVSSPKPLTSPLDTALSFIFPVIHGVWPCSDNSDTPPPPLLWDTSQLIFSGREPEAALCVSQTKHLTFLLGVFYFSHCCRKLSVKCASGAAVCSSAGFLWGTGHRLSVLSCSCDFFHWILLKIDSWLLQCSQNQSISILTNVRKISDCGYFAR